ncbi:hypothetical protein [Micromonospora haikouensis]|uniref:hypothetical protein n=1 Tax=Micromonospora haikouensis TaxID=686309 RepID=UPI003D8F2097
MMPTNPHSSASSTAFFRSALLGDQQAEAIISGCVDPYALFTVVDAEKIVPEPRRGVGRGGERGVDGRFGRGSPGGAGYRPAIRLTRSVM